jgi:heat shock protein HtpX
MGVVDAAQTAQRRFVVEVLLRKESTVKRILLFIVTNLAVVLVLSVVLHLTGLDRYASGGNMGGLLVFAAVFGFGGAFISLAMSKWMAKRATGARVIEQPANATEQWLVDTVARQAQAAGIGMPEVAIYEAPEINAFATGMKRDSALVAVSTGLLHHMNPDEAEAVLAHEVSHVANGDMVTLTLIQGVVNTFVIFLARVIGGIVDKTVFRTENANGPAYWVTTLVAELVLGVLASVIVMWFSRQREFRADAGSARLAGSHKMIAALERLKLNHESEMPSQMRAFAIASGTRGGLMRLFMSHPPLDERIAALRADSGMARAYAR